MALTEIMSSRRQGNGPYTITFTRAYECLVTEIKLTDTAGGWVGNGITLPAVGDALDVGVWTGKVTPRITNVHIDPKYTRGKARITVSYAAPRVWGG